MLNTYHLYHRTRRHCIGSKCDEVRRLIFIPKPVDGASLLSSVERALQQNLANRREAIEHASIVARYQSLTPRERQVLPMLTSGLLNKQVAFELGITEYTVQLHRGHIMRKWKLTPLLP